jgi:tetratricopeptide (TPR) repeat protein
MNTAFKKLLTLCLLAFSAICHAQSNPPQTREECMELIYDGLRISAKGDYARALEYFIIAEAAAEKNHWQKEFIEAEANIGLTYSNLSNYGEALGYYKTALDVPEIEPVMKVKIIANIGVTYTNEKDYTTALEYYMKAYAVSKAKKFDHQTVFIACNIADVYDRIGNYKEASRYLMEVKDLPMNDMAGQFWKTNYAENLALQGRLDEAEKIGEELIDKVEKVKVGGCYTCITKLLATIYSKNNKEDLALFYAKKGLNNTFEMKSRIDFYDQLSAIYFQKKEYATAKQYTDSVIIAKDSLNASVNRGLFQSNKIKLRIRDYQNELKAKTENQETQRNLFIVSILLVLVISFALYRGLRHKLARQEKERIIADKQQMIVNLELEGLKNNIAEKNRNLSAKTLYLSGRNELIEEVIGALTEIPEISGNKEVTEYMKTLRGYLKADSEWDDFISYFEQVNPEFLKTLKARHPQLTATDIRFLCYIYMNLDMREIGSTFNITYNAAMKRQRRIKEKMEIDKDVPLYEYLLHLA